MARWEFKLPDIGEGIAEGEIVSWLVRPGDAVTEDQPVVEVMTDKATVTITAPKAGVVLETRGRVGEIVAVHGVLVVFELEGAGVPLAPPSHARASEANGSKDIAIASAIARSVDDGPAATAVGDLRETLPGMKSAGRAYYNDRPLATPATRKLARDLSIDLRNIPPSGPDGRVTKTDVEGFTLPAPGADARGTEPSTTTSTSTSTTGGAAAGDASRSEERVPMVGIRRKIAQKMTLSTHTAAHYTFVDECDATALKALRARLKGAAEARGAALTFLPFVVKAVVAALKKHPILNTTLDETHNEIVFRKYFHIGIATATDAGLVVPVVRDADRKGLLEIARDIERLSSEARAGKARPEDLSGSTFTITSLGAKGGLFATPIINFPEVAILGVHQMKTRPVVRDGQIAIGDVMLLSLSFDHRIVDGHVGAAFALDVIAYLEAPETLLLEMV
jgi:pyruvate dehydrogenase E2 component (dihydrolipoamide acetyltransferase)